MSPTEHICFQLFLFYFFSHTIESLCLLNPSVPRPSSDASYIALAFSDAVVCDACLHSQEAKISHIANLIEVMIRREYNEGLYLGVLQPILYKRMILLMPTKLAFFFGG